MPTRVDEIAERVYRLSTYVSPRVLGLMHGPAFTGQCPPALEALAGHDDTELRRARSSIDECR